MLFLPRNVAKIPKILRGLILSHITSFNTSYFILKISYPMMYKFYRARTPKDFNDAKTLFLEYAQWLQVDLCFQEFDKELANIEHLYNEPTGGILLLETGGEIVGCVGVKGFKTDMENTVCELKRMYVREGHRGHGFGRLFLRKATAWAVELGYKTMRLDTLNRLEAAIWLYKDSGFVEIAPYYDNPLSEVRYFEKKIDPSV